MQLFEVLWSDGHFLTLALSEADALARFAAHYVDRGETVPQAYATTLIGRLTWK